MRPTWGKIASHLGAGIRHAQLTLKRPGLKKVLAQTFWIVRAGTAIVHRPLMPYGAFCV
jgi:2-succinyl-5-enolpyruvyl-6-hydroxy-3-cyclohexene-1-carboxylate synthase